MNKSRQANFQHARPIYVKIPFRSNAKTYERGEEYPWQTLKVDVEKVTTLFNQGFLHHNDKHEEASKGTIGDGLDALSMDELKLVVEKINETVKTKARNNTEYLRKKVPTSKVKEKQIGHIRRWRMTYGDME